MSMALLHTKGTMSSIITLVSKFRVHLYQKSYTIVERIILQENTFVFALVRKNSGEITQTKTKSVETPKSGILINDKGSVKLVGFAIINDH